MAIQQISQGENGKLTYKFSTQDTVPPYGADYFYINPSNGEILTINNLRGDNLKQYKFVVIAQDGGVPKKQSSIPVTIIFERNPSGPLSTYRVSTRSLSMKVHQSTVISS
ncbi:unnamed protein product [Mytilus coruscus]|uniref:Cadherin domain-containing protein n=1 Tax=Mytilus coruscus TaxID=42192 RepID=A0A6J8CSZ5_MYTCO|nr:unnamed protein product [Mytilus coruscus]